MTAMLRQASTATMVGREPELAAMGQAFQNCLADRVRWVLVRGEAGLGKTRLVTEFTHNLSSDADGVAPVVAIGQCVDLGGIGSALVPVREIVRELLRRFGLTAVTEAAGRGRRVLASLLPELGEAADVDPDGLRDGVALLLEALSAMRPVVVVVEDAHWADPATVSFLRGLAWTCQQGRITIVLTYRPDEIGPQHPLEPLVTDLARSRQPTEIELDPLTLAEVAQQASRLLGADLDAPAVRRVFKRSGGVPFFVEELARWEGGRGLPDNVRNLVLSNYQRLSPSTRQVLRLIATGGTTVAHDVVAAAFEDDPTILDEAAREAIEAHLLLRDPQRYVFRHALLREAILEDSVPGERIRNHASLGAALSEHPSGRRAEIAHHWLEAHDLPKAFAATIAAIPEARAVGAVASAAALGEQAIQLWPDVPDAGDIADTDRVQLLAAIAQDWHLGGEQERGLGVLAIALGEIPPDDERIVDLLQAKYILQTETGHPAATKTLEDALALMPTPGSPAAHITHATVRADLAHRIWMSGGDLGRAVELLTGSADEALAAGGSNAAARSMTYLGNVCSTRGDIPAAEQAFARARELDRSQGTVQRLAAFEGRARMDWGEYREAVRLAEEALASSAEDGTRQYWAENLVQVAAEAHLGLGEPEFADRALADLPERPITDSDVENTAAVRYRILSWRDDLVESETQARVVIEGLSPISQIHYQDRPLVAACSAEVALAWGDVAAAWGAVEQALGVRPPSPEFDPRLASLGAAALAGLRRARRATEPDPEPDLRRMLGAASLWPIADDWRCAR